MIATFHLRTASWKPRSDLNQDVLKRNWASALTCQELAYLKNLVGHFTSEGAHSSFMKEPEDSVGNSLDGGAQQFGLGFYCFKLQATMKPK